MFTRFFPADRHAGYQGSPHKARIDRIAQRLVEQRYLPVVVAQHLREWLRFSAYLQARQLALPLWSREAHVQAYVTQRVAPGRSASRVRFVRASVRIFLDADSQGRFRRRVSTAVPCAVPPWMRTTLATYLTFLQAHRGLSTRTLARREWQLARLGRCLDSLAVTSIAMIAPVHLQRFFGELQRQAVATRLTYAVTVRSFLGWAYGASLLPVDVRAAVLAPRRFRQAGIRDVLSETDVARILAAVDRSSATGRRDYAVLLLAARYGLRPSEIRHLTVEALQWRQGLLSIQQSKTGRLLVLPLLPDVIEALTAYLRDGRPETTARHVFVRHRAPFEPFVAANNLAAIMRGALQRAGLEERPGRRGLYLFRHTLASHMLATGCALKTIGDVLGHASTETTMEYANVDLVALRRVALSEAEVRS